MLNVGYVSESAQRCLFLVEITNRRGPTQQKFCSLLATYTEFTLATIYHHLGGMGRLGLQHNQICEGLYEIAK